MRGVTRGRSTAYVVALDDDPPREVLPSLAHSPPPEVLSPLSPLAVRRALREGAPVALYGGALALREGRARVELLPYRLVRVLACVRLSPSAGESLTALWLHHNAAVEELPRGRVLVDVTASVRGTAEGIGVGLVRWEAWTPAPVRWRLCAPGGEVLLVVDGVTRALSDRLGALVTAADDASAVAGDGARVTTADDASAVAGDGARVTTALAA